MDTQETRHILAIRSWFVRCYFIVTSLLAHGFLGILCLLMGCFSIHFYSFLYFSIHFYSFLFISIHFYPFLSIYILSCLTYTLCVGYSLIFVLLIFKIIYYGTAKRDDYD